MFDMINIFEVFLPQLLRYPNPTDPLNGEAAALLMRDPKTYETKVKGTIFLGYSNVRAVIDSVVQNMFRNTLPRTPQTKPVRRRMRRAI